MEFNKLSKISFFICLCAIEYLATTSLEIKPLQNNWDKANHFIAFFTLYLTLSFGYPNLKIFKKSILLVLFGLQIEIVQYFIPNRQFSLLDMLADCIGIVIGIIIFIVAKNFKK